MTNTDIRLRDATADDALLLAKLIDIAGEGIPSWLWQQSATVEETFLDVGAARARRTTGGFSFSNAVVALRGEQPVGMVLSYPIDAAPGDDPDDLPAPVAPFVALEIRSVGTWYINALAVLPGYRSCGAGTVLMRHSEKLARAAGYEKMSIQVYGQNTGAVRLYTRLGYTQISAAPVRLHPCQPYYTGDVLLLTKDI
ncbi:GNAT family N-acetyltransferase [uncultured Roseobacter sp.]|uniref:GNAT family N-acetyltransferase n=1 Tax=uncultured Roseobacter sp. TaxID=114847 RepID=UPI002626FB38|nr:GNAT family N-acetyltransferase [uncultured Roseobacter sp.]